MSGVLSLKLVSVPVANDVVLTVWVETQSRVQKQGNLCPFLHCADMRWSRRQQPHEC